MAKDYTPPSSRSGEINILNEAIQVAVQSTIQACMANGSGSGAGMEQCREELDSIKQELRGEFGALRANIGVEFSAIRQDIVGVKADLAEGKTAFALINQRMQLEKEARERELASDRERRKRDVTPTKGYRYASAPQPSYVNPALGADPEEKPLIPAKILNAIILAAVAAAGAALWGVLSASIWPTPKAIPDQPPKTAPALVPPEPGIVPPGH